MPLALGYWGIKLLVDRFDEVIRFAAGDRLQVEQLNFHHPYWFPKEQSDAKSRLVRRYQAQDMRTPYEKLRSLPDAASFLRPGLTLEQLEAQARRISDNDSAARLLGERKKLFEPILADLSSAA